VPARSPSACTAVRSTPSARDRVRHPHDLGGRRGVRRLVDAATPRA
jgi:hypothetical protein